MIFVLGSTTVDLIITGIKTAPSLGQDEFTSSNLAFLEQPLRISLGGNGANSAFILAQLGTPAGLLSACGDDAAGHLVKDWLDQVQVDCRGLYIDPGSATASTTVLMDQEHNRQSYYHPGALHQLQFGHLSVGLLKQAEALLISGYTLLPQLRTDGYQQLVARAKELEVMTAIDLGPAIGELPDLPELAPLLAEVDLVICNEYELKVIGGEESIENNLDLFFEAGAAQLVLKRGAAGASWHRPAEARLNQPAYSVEATVTIGAGDSFNSGLLAALVEGKSRLQALQFANAIAALVVGSPRGVLGSPTRSQVENFLEHHQPDWQTNPESEIS